jgi:hypothetical protein
MSTAAQLLGPESASVGVFAWTLYMELRKEILERQKLRTQFLGFKIALISAAVGLIGANRDKTPHLDELLVVPAIAAFFFDFMITSYGAAIHRIAFYCREVLEPRIRVGYMLPSNFPLYEKYIFANPQNIANIGNLGLTLLVYLGATVILFLKQSKLLAATVFTLLTVLFVFDAITAIRRRELQLPPIEE